MGFDRRGWLALLLLVPPASARAGGVEFHALAAARGAAVESRAPWISGGFGRLTEGRAGAAREWLARGEAHLGVDWPIAEVLDLRVHATARGEPGGTGGRRAGLVEVFLQYRPELSPSAVLRLRAGLLFPPTSRENVDPLWQSPYTLTLSAVNAWIGEEVRLTGLDAGVRLGASPESRFELGAMAFGGNDSSGALLAWRGWALGSRLAVVGETVPLPPLPTLAAGGAFSAQRDDGTRPIDELDGRLGWHARARWSRAGRALVQAAWTDNRGDRALHRGQYAWATRFASLGAEVQLGPVRLVGEGLAGDTGMGTRQGPRVDARVRAGYVLAAWSSAEERLRLTVRFEAFDNADRDGQAEPNGEDGRAVTVAAFYAPRPWLRLGVEWLDLRSDRPAAAFAGTPASTDARRTQAELRLRF